ncbi:MAG: phospholipase D-like domain-containing protein [Elusimicrobiaceae bacterium]|nr:phospholipase D-like domain-containing protein [Elusimicrobiaceae bacterium]
MKKLIILLSAALVLCAARTARADGDKSLFTSAAVITESVPLETDYGSALTARAPQVWLEMINSAQDSIDIGVFYIISRPGTAMETVISALKAAAARGVKVRILVDSVFYRKMPDTPDELKKVPGIQLRTVDYNKINGGVMHAKYFVVDGKELYAGSQNFDWRSLEQIHEVGVRLRIPEIAANFTDVFNLDWQLAQNPAVPSRLPAAKNPVNRAHPVRFVWPGSDEQIEVYPAFGPQSLNPNGLDCEITELLNGINKAEKYIKIQVMSFKTRTYGTKEQWTELTDALAGAAGRGVKIRLIVADWTMSGDAAARIKTLAKTPNISVKVSAISQYSKEFVEFARVEHCKYFTADGKISFISTSNWERSYFYQARNAAIILAGAEVASVMEDMFDTSWNSRFAAPVDPDKKYIPPRREKKK